jgi:hypothetical protein
MSQVGWGFYGRQQELSILDALLRRGRWFFLKVSGRRRIGKTTLSRIRARQVSHHALLLSGQLPAFMARGPVRGGVLDELQAGGRSGSREACRARGYLPEDLTDLTAAL